MSNFSNFMKTRIEKNYEKNKHSGEIVRIIYKADNYTVAIMSEHITGDSIKIVCKFAIQEGDNVVAHGKWKDVENYGWQFEANCMEKDLNLSKNGLIKFLKGPDFKGIGTKTATKIADKFEENFDYVITNESDRLINELSIKRDVVENLRRLWVSQKLQNMMVVNLSAYPLTQLQILNLLSVYGQSAIDILTKNPYSLIEFINGYGFKTADAIALQNGIESHSNFRLQACTEYITNIFIKDAGGHCWIDYDNLLKVMSKLLDLEYGHISNFLENHLDSRKIISFNDDGILKYSSTYVFNQENFLVNYILENSEEIPITQYEDNIKHFELDKLNAAQREAVINTFRYDLSIITGKAGTGKTFVISYILEIFQKLGYNIACAAPTGKAARRMTEMTDFPASTIHRLLHYDSSNFEYNKDNKLDAYDMIIIDEFSMVDVYLAYSLFSALSENTKVVIVGDHNQLPPIGAGGIFIDMLKYNKSTKRDNINAVTELTNVMRQAGNLKKNSVDILDGIISTEITEDWRITFNDIFADPEVISDTIAKKLSNSEKYINFKSEDIQIITPRKDNFTGVEYLNKLLQHTIQKAKYGVDIIIDDKKAVLHRYDRVIQMANDYTIDVMNGTLGEVLYISNDGIITIKFEGNVVVNFEFDSPKLLNVSLAYALTIHKTQGSEFPCVIVVLHSSHGNMLNRNLLYTAVTRAKEKVILLGDEIAIKLALEKINDNKRTNFDYLMRLNYKKN